MIHHEHNLIINSDTKSNAQNISDNGASFEVHYANGFNIPREAKHVTLSVVEANIWWTMPNILTGINDTVEIKWEDQDNLGSYFQETIVLDQGLYSPAQMFASINQAFEVEHDAPSILISPIADISTGILTIRLNYDNTTVFFTTAQSPLTILGFPAVDLVRSGGSELFEGTSVAQFNTINHFLIHSDMVRRGISTNNSHSSVIAMIGIDVNPGSQIVYRPYHPANVEANNLIDNNTAEFRFWLTDGNNNEVNTAGESWSARLVLAYDL